MGKKKESEQLYKVTLTEDIELDGVVYEAGEVTGSKELCERLHAIQSGQPNEEKQEPSGKTVKVESSFRHNSTKYKEGQVVPVEELGNFVETLENMGLVSKS